MTSLASTQTLLERTGAIRLGLVGLGKIARDAHLPAIAQTPSIQLFAIASRNAALSELPHYHDLTSMLEREPKLQAIVLCQPPQVRYAAARAALTAGKHVFLEKPPGATVTEVQSLSALAKDRGVTLFASWHSRHAAGVEPARAWLANRQIASISIRWTEDVRYWHPGQEWVKSRGGFGVFDPGINALSILTKIVGAPLRLVDAWLETPANWQSPIAATLTLAADDIPIAAHFDWRHKGRPTWDIAVKCTDGQHLLLADGGARLSLNGQTQSLNKQSEYLGLYQHFASLVQNGQSDVDLSPLKIVADAFLCGHIHPTDHFDL